MPRLILQLRPHREVLQLLLKEAAFSFPNSLASFENWQPPRLEEADETTTEATKTDLSEAEKEVKELLFQHQATTEALAHLLGIENITWQAEITTNKNTLSNSEMEVKQLLDYHLATLAALSILLGLEN